MRSPGPPEEPDDEVGEPRRLYLVVHGARREDSEPWLAGLGRAGFAVRWAGAGGEADLSAALRQPLDLVLVWDDEGGERALAALAALRREVSAARVIVVAHPRAGEAAVRCLERGAYGVLEGDQPDRLPPLAGRVLADLHAETVTALAGRIAHDLNNLLAPIPLALQLVRDRGPTGIRAGTGAAGGHLATIDVSVRGSMGAVRELSELVLARPGRPLEVRAKHLVALAAGRLREGFGGTRQVLGEYPPDLAPVRVEATRALQVLCALGRRVRDAAGDGEELVLRGDGVELPTRPGAPAPGAGVALAVAAGRSPDPGTAAWAPGGGGAELATLREVVEAEGGTLEVAPGSGPGRAFRVLLPAAAPAGRPRPAARPVRAGGPAEEGEPRAGSGARRPPGGRATREILVVEDEEEVREVTRAVLESRGFRVIAAADGAEGVALLADRLGRVDLCLVDMGLPRMDGPATLRALRRIDPAVKIIASSGAERDPARLEHEEDGVDAFLVKPYDAETLLRVVRRTLGEERAAEPAPSGPSSPRR